MRRLTILFLVACGVCLSTVTAAQDTPDAPPADEAAPEGDTEPSGDEPAEPKVADAPVEAKADADAAAQTPAPTFTLARSPSKDEVSQRLEAAGMKLDANPTASYEPDAVAWIWKFSGTGVAGMALLYSCTEASVCEGHLREWSARPDARMATADKGLLVVLIPGKGGVAELVLKNLARPPRPVAVAKEAPSGPVGLASGITDADVADITNDRQLVPARSPWEGKVILLQVLGGIGFGIVDGLAGLLVGVLLGNVVFNDPLGGIFIGVLTGSVSTLLGIAHGVYQTGEWMDMRSSYWTALLGTVVGGVLGIVLDIGLGTDGPALTSLGLVSGAIIGYHGYAHELEGQNFISPVVYPRSALPPQLEMPSARVFQVFAVPF